MEEMGLIIGWTQELMKAHYTCFIRNGELWLLTDPDLNMCTSFYLTLGKLTSLDFGFFLLCKMDMKPLLQEL